MRTYTKTNNEIQDLILETLEFETEVGKMLLKIDDNKKKIQEYFDNNNLKHLVVETSTDATNDVKVVCKKYERANIKYDIEKLKKKLDDELFIEVTNRSYIIKDINTMISLVKDAGIKAKEFKELIEPKITVNSQAIKNLYDVGELTMKDLKGAYTATISKSIKISEETGGKD